MKNLLVPHCVLASFAMVLLSQTASAAGIIFDDFNVNEGHMGYAPGFAGQSVGESTLSTADRVTTGAPLEGAGHQKLVLVHDGAFTNLRIRHLGGATPFGSAQAGAPASNVSFTTSLGMDGFIGFYLRTTASSFTVGLNLDGADGAGASMDMGTPRAVIGDGEWHLYEWNLDDDNDWDPVTSIGGNGVIEDGQHSFDSIYIFANQAGVADQAQPDIFLDFIAKNDSGSVADLIPEPSSASLLALGAFRLFTRRRAFGRNLVSSIR